MRGNYMKVPLLDLKTQYKQLRELTKTLLDDILDSQYFIGGKYVARFEEEIASYCNVKAAVGVSSGTDALLSSLMAMDIVLHIKASKIQNWDITPEAYSHSYQAL